MLSVPGGGEGVSHECTSHFKPNRFGAADVRLLDLIHFDVQCECNQEELEME